MRVAVLSILIAGCAYDFEDYLPVFTDASTDTRADTAVQDTAPVDVGCTPTNGATCYATAKSCGDMCRATRATCEAGCGSGSCRSACRNAESSCKNTCVTNCSNCTISGGCLTASRCSAEVG